MTEKSLEKYGMSEMSASELNEVNGGGFVRDVAGITHRFLHSFWRVFW